MQMEQIGTDGKWDRMGVGMSMGRQRARKWQQGPTQQFLYISPPSAAGAAVLIHSRNHHPGGGPAPIRIISTIFIHLSPTPYEHTHHHTGRRRLPSIDILKVRCQRQPPAHRASSAPRTVGAPAIPARGGPPCVLSEHSQPRTPNTSPLIQHSKKLKARNSNQDHESDDAPK